MRSDKSNINSGAYRPAIKAGLVGSLHGLTVGAPTVNNYPLTFSGLSGDNTTIGTPVQV